MATVENSSITTGEDAVAIAELKQIVARQQQAFLDDPFPSLQERTALLGALAGMLLGYRSQIEDAMSSDFGTHPRLATDLIEVLGPAGRAGYAVEQLEAWMAPEPRWADPTLFGSGRAFVQPQPKGVIGNIVPWNFPFDLSVGPLVEMLAAGNRVVIKPSEYAPACGELLRDMIRATFEPRPGRRHHRRRRARAGLRTGPMGSPAVHRQHRRRTGDRQSRRRAARARDARAGRQVPRDHRRGQHRPRDNQAVARHQGGQERTNVHLGRLLPGPAQPPRRVRAIGRRARPGRNARLLELRELHRDHLRAPPRTAGAPTRPGTRAGLRRAGARAGRQARPGDPADAAVAGDRSSRRSRVDARRDLRTDPAGQALRPTRRGDRTCYRRRTPARALRLHHTTRLPQRTCYGAPPQEARASTPPPSTERCPRSRSGASGSAASDATTASKDSASSPISAACSSAAKAISSRPSPRHTGPQRKRSSMERSAPPAERGAARRR